MTMPAYEAPLCANNAPTLSAETVAQVWDLRMLRLLRSVPCLDGTVLTWAGSGDAAFASLRRGSDDLHSPAHARRARHALHTAFRTVWPIWSQSPLSTVSLSFAVFFFRISLTLCLS